jgi:hypothetical protein
MKTRQRASYLGGGARLRVWRQPFTDMKAHYGISASTHDKRCWHAGGYLLL